jgi:threonylcarbamoyladenosine tRNA methylthiotransferase MtaB
METQLRKNGHQIVGLEESPDTCIINTCTVTKKSDDQSRNLIRKASKTSANLIVTGCYAELNPSDVENIAGKGALVDNSNKPYIINRFIEDTSSTDSSIIPKPLTRSKYFLKIQDGCDNQCTYCRVWKARGKSRSIPLEEAVKIAQKAETSGYMEIDLTGIHLGMYGRDLPEHETGVGGLLETLLNKTKKCRFRLSSLEVNEIDERIIELMGESRVCRHLHIPLQSGDTRVLSDMGRDYTPEQYANKINKIYKRVGQIGLGADLIAGFPTESTDAFERTIGLIQSLPFTYLHVFPYSKRPNTVASSLSDSVGMNERKRRAAELRALGNSFKIKHIKANIDKTLEVLLESCADGPGWTGTSDNYLKVKEIQIPRDYHEGMDLKGRLVNVEAHLADGHSVKGKLLSIL